MKAVPLNQRLAVCSWSLQPEGPHRLIEQLRSLDLPRVHIALDPIRTQPEQWESFKALCAEHGVQIVSGMFGTIGEDYSTLESIRRTGGLAPDETWEENWRNVQAIADLAKDMELNLVTFHAGFLPEDERAPEFAKLFQRIWRVADLFAAKGIELGFETGQETAPTLREFLEKLNRANVGVNFDPANMILYDKGNPIEALRVLGPWLKQCHVKDATKTRQPGTWGDEVVVGTGEVDWPEFFRALDQLKFSGYCCIEREAGQQRTEDIRSAREFVEAVLEKVKREM
jgi:sugar phosphate isomerase/epimerase